MPLVVWPWRPGNGTRTNTGENGQDRIAAIRVFPCGSVSENDLLVNQHSLLYLLLDSPASQIGKETQRKCKQRSYDQKLWIAKPRKAAILGVSKPTAEAVERTRHVQDSHK